MKCDTIPDLERFLAIQEQALGPTAPEVATTMIRLAELYLNKGNLDKAEALYKKAFEICSNARGVHRQGIEGAEERLNEIRRQRASGTTHKPASAKADSKPKPAESGLSFPSFGSSAPPASEADLRISQPNLNGVQNVRAGGSHPRAIAGAIQDAEIELELLKQMVGLEHPSVADMLTKLADLHCRLRQYSQMEPLLMEALKIRESACGPDHPSLATELKNLGLLYLTQQRFEQAEPLLKKAIALRERTLGRSHPRVADLEQHYAQLLRRTNRVALAEALERHVNDIRSARDTANFSRDGSFFSAQS